MTETVGVFVVVILAGVALAVAMVWIIEQLKPKPAIKTVTVNDRVFEVDSMHGPALTFPASGCSETGLLVVKANESDRAILRELSKQRRVRNVAVVLRNGEVFAGTYGSIEDLRIRGIDSGSMCFKIRFDGQPENIA